MVLVSRVSFVSFISILVTMFVFASSSSVLSQLSFPVLAPPLPSEDLPFPVHTVETIKFSGNTHSQ